MAGLRYSPARGCGMANVVFLPCGPYCICLKSASRVKLKGLALKRAGYVAAAMVVVVVDRSAAAKQQAKL